jgi:hypothetical protein
MVYSLAQYLRAKSAYIVLQEGIIPVFYLTITSRGPNTLAYVPRAVSFFYKSVNDKTRSCCSSNINTTLRQSVERQFTKWQKSKYIN